MNYSNYQLRLEQLEHELKCQGLELKKKQMEMLRHKSMISNMRVCIRKLEKLSNLKQLKELKTKTSTLDEIKLTAVMEKYREIQTERNEAIINLHEKEIQIVELLAEVNTLKSNCYQKPVEIIEEEKGPQQKL